MSPSRIRACPGNSARRFGSVGSSDRDGRRSVLRRGGRAAFAGREPAPAALARAGSTGAGPRRVRRMELSFCGATSQIAFHADAMKLNESQALNEFVVADGRKIFPRFLESLRAESSVRTDLLGAFEA